MRVIKANGIYTITLLDKEVDNIISVCDLYPMAWCLGEIQDNLVIAKEYGICDQWLKNWNWIPPREFEP